MIQNKMELIQKCLTKITNDRDHIPPAQNYQQLVKKYKGKHSIINYYLQLEQKDPEKYFPAEPPPEQIIQVLMKQTILQARVVFLGVIYRPQYKDMWYQRFFQRQNMQTIFGKYCKLRGDYQQRYLADMGFIQQDVAKAWRWRHFVTFKNYSFYSTEQRIKKLHQKQGDYTFLQDRHDYIQWMFPNHFQSMFNSNSFPMSYYEVELFKKSRKLGLRMLKSIIIFFDFMGLELDIDNGYLIQIVDIERLREALLVNTHNHLRIRRILACLSVVGYRHIALKLIKFLGELVKTKTMFSRLDYTFSRQWQKYSNNYKQKALQLCFHPESQFPQPHFVISQIQNQLKNKIQYKIDISQYQTYDQKNIQRYETYINQNASKFNRSYNNCNSYRYQYSSQEDEQSKIKNKQKANNQDKQSQKKTGAEHEEKGQNILKQTGGMKQQQLEKQQKVSSETFKMQNFD